MFFSFSKVELTKNFKFEFNVYSESLVNSNIPLTCIKFRKMEKFTKENKMFTIYLGDDTEIKKHSRN